MGSTLRDGDGECLSDNALAELAEGHLSGDGAVAARRHIDGCPGCRQLLAAMMTSLRPPLAFEEYRLLARLGEGETGEVWEALDTRLDRRVAIKFLHRGALDASRRERFDVEARALARLRHPGVVGIYRAGEIDGHPYIVSELVEGRSLAEVDLPLPSAEVVRLGMALADALAVAHRQGVLHRDLKPANIMLTPSGEPRLLDFGLAKLGGVEPSAPPPDGDPATTPWGGATEVLPRVTRTGTLVGTPLYLAPESWERLPATPRADLYALGVVLYELAGGHPPFPATTIDALRVAVTTRDVPPLPRTGPLAVEPSLAAIIEACLARDPERRVSSAEALLAALAPLARADGPTSTPPPSSGAGSSTPRPTWRWVAAALLLVLALGAGAAWRSRRAEPSTIEARPRGGDRPTVAVVGFRNAGGGEDDWIGPSLAEALGAELAIGGSARVVAGDEVRRMRDDLGDERTGPDVEQDGGAARVARYLGASALVSGRYQLMSPSTPGASRQLRLTWRLSGLSVGEGAEIAGERELFLLVARVGGRLRERLGLGPVSAAEHEALRSALPDDPEAQRLFARALIELGRHEMITARDLLVKAAALSPRSPLIHRELSRVAGRLGDEPWMREEARLAFELSRGLSREAQLRSEAAWDSAVGRYDQAAELYRALMRFYPDDLVDGLELAGVLYLGGHLEDSLRALDSLRQLAPPLGDDPRIDLAGEFALRMNGRVAEALGLSRTAVAKGRARGNRFIVGRARMVEGHALLNQGRLAEAEPAFAEAVPLLHAVGEYIDELWALDGQVTVRLLRGQVRSAVADCLREVARAQAIHSSSMEIFAGLSCSVPHRESGQLGTARRMAQEALDRCRAGEGQDCLGSTEIRLAGAQLLAGDPAAALRTLSDEGGRAAAGPAGSARSWGTPHFAVLRGEALLLSGETTRARAATDAAMAAFEEGGARRHGLRARRVLASVAFAEGRLEEAESLVRAALASLTEEGAVVEELSARALLAEIRAARRGPSEALAELLPFEEQALASESLPARAQVVTTLALLRAGAGVKASRAALEAVLAECETQGYLPLALSARLARAAQLRVEGNRVQAALERRAVVERARSLGLGRLERSALASLR